MKKELNKSVKKRKTHPKIIITALIAIVFIILAFISHWSFIFPAILLWWMNKRYIKKHLGV